MPIQKAMKISFSQWFRIRRDFVKLSQSQIANHLKVGQNTISNWENGVSKPSLNPEQMELLCQLLSTNLGELSKASRGEFELK